jgi:hypothetical protein
MHIHADTGATLELKAMDHSAWPDSFVLRIKGEDPASGATVYFNAAQLAEIKTQISRALAVAEAVKAVAA